MYFSLERRHNATFHPKGIFRHHWISMFTYLFTWKVLQDKNRSSWFRGSVPSSQARGQRFKPRRRQYFKLLWPRRFFTPTPVESLPNLNPAFLLSASRPFNRWPSVWFGSMLCGTACDSTDSREISNDGNPLHPPPLHFLPTFFTRWRPSWVPLAAWNAIYQLLNPT